MTEREQFDAFYATTSPLESTEATAFACWCAARSADEALMRESLDALELARRDGGPESFYASTDEAIESAINNLRSRLEKDERTTT